MSVTTKDTSVATDDEMAAITAAVQAYLLEEQEQVSSDLSASQALSPWAVANRHQAIGSGDSHDASDNQRWSKGKLWGRAFALAISLAVASLLPGGLSAQAADKQIRVCLSSSLQKVDLDFPDGGSVYTVADGTLVGKIAPQSAWNLSLARSTTKGNSTIVFNGKSSRDKIAPAATIAKVAFIPSTGSFFWYNQRFKSVGLALTGPSQERRGNCLFFSNRCFPGIHCSS